LSSSEELFPELLEIEDKHLREQCELVLDACIARGAWTEPTEAPFVLDIPAAEFNGVDHVRAVTRLLAAAADICSEILGIEGDGWEDTATEAIKQILGIGEPLDNYAHVVAFLRNVGHPAGINIGYRHISLSTCGIVNKINDLAKEAMPITLSISLHAPNDQIRDTLMPINKKYNIDSLLDACNKYTQITSRRISFEYAMIEGVNDTEQCADELSRRLKGMLCHVNLIPVNPVDGCGFRRSSPQRVAAFQAKLEQHGITATLRRELGGDIDAACGQLRNNNAINPQ